MSLPRSPREAPGTDGISSWRPSPTTLTLARDEVHVWRAALDLEARRVKSLYQSLSPDEQSRAGRLYFPKDRVRFVVARGALRAIVGFYLGVQPGELRFCYNAYGKPALSGQCGEEALHFNVSHSHGLALYALSYGRALGKSPPSRS